MDLFLKFRRYSLPTANHGVKVPPPPPLPRDGDGDEDGVDGDGGRGGQQGDTCQWGDQKGQRVGSGGSSITFSRWKVS